MMTTASPPHKFSCFNLGPWETLYCNTNDCMWNRTKLWSPAEMIKYKATVIPRQPQLLLFFLTLAGPGLTHPWTLAGHLAFHTSINCFSYVEVFLFNPSLPYYTCASTSVSVGNTFCDVDSDPSSYYKLLRWYVPAVPALIGGTLHCNLYHVRKQLKGGCLPIIYQRIDDDGQPSKSNQSTHVSSFACPNFFSLGFPCYIGCSMGLACRW